MMATNTNLAFRFVRVLAAALAASTLLGCGGYTISDGIDLRLDFNPLVGPSDELHSPYVAGATVDVYARAWGSAENDTETWTFESSDPSVARVVSNDRGHARVEMVAPGTFTLTLRGGSDREVRHAVELEVGAPVSADLVWHGDLLVEHQGQDADLEELHIEDARTLVGEAGAFLVQFRDARGRRLYGSGALRVEAAPEAGATVYSTLLQEDRDWLIVTPLSAGDHEVRILAGETPVDAFLVTAVTPDAIERIVLEGQSEQDQERGACLVVVAHAEDAQGRRIYGIDYAWDIDGAALRGYGDVLHYAFDPDRPVIVGASFDGRRTEARIRASGVFSVSDTAHVGCSAGGTTAVTASLPILLVALLVTCCRRRRRPESLGAPKG